MIYNFDELSFQILRIDRFFHEEGIYEVKARPYAALSLRVKGVGSFEVMGHSFVSKPGDVLFIPAEVPYKVEYSVSESIVVELRECNYRDAENHTFESLAVMEPAFCRLLEEWNDRHSPLRAKSAVYDILDKMSLSKSELVISPEFNNCIEYIEKNFSDPTLGVEKMCEVGFMSRSGLQRAFKRHIGISPGEYLVKLRMNRALELLSGNSHTVKEVAFMSGFTDEKYFSRVFKQKFGHPPKSLKTKIML